MKGVRETFLWPKLNARQFLLCGKIPGLLVQEHGNRFPVSKRTAAVNKCIADGEVTDVKVTYLLQSFLTGAPWLVQAPLLALMDTFVDEQNIIVIKWIPYHMSEILKSFSYELSYPMKSLLREICHCFDQLPQVKDESGEDWEILFVIVLLIRCITGSFESNVFNLNMMQICPVTFNQPIDRKVDFGSIKTVDKLVEVLTEPDTYPHLAVYFPSNAKFEMYDVIVIVFFSKEDKLKYGYQLRSGRNQMNRRPSSKVDKSWVISGDARELSEIKNGWVYPSNGEVCAFLGLSGQDWTPGNLKLLD